MLSVAITKINVLTILMFRCAIFALVGEVSQSKMRSPQTEL